MIRAQRLWLARLLIGLVLLVNVQCAILFVGWPAHYISAFELSGVAGEAAVRGIGVLFLMWNVPYAIACLDPYKYRLSHYEAVAMQAIGLIGESLILWNLPTGHSVLATSLSRFIAFDAAGLAFLALGAFLVHPAFVTRS